MSKAVLQRVNSWAKSLVFLVPIFLVFQASSAEAVYCDLMEARWERAANVTHSNAAYRDDVKLPFIIVGSNQMLRELNNRVFDSWTAASEHVTNVMSFLMQFHFYKIVRSEPATRVHEISVPYLKQVEISFFVSGLTRYQVRQLVRQAKERAMGDLVNYIYGVPGEHMKRIAEITGDRSTFAKSGEYRFPEGKTFIEAMDPADLTALRAAVKQSYSNSADFNNAFARNYGIGIGSSNIDAQFAARLSSLETLDGRPVAFDLYAFDRSLDHALTLRKQVRDALPPSEAEMLRLFREYRKLESPTDPTLWTQEMRDMVGLGKETADSIKVKKFVANFGNYFEVANLFDYLPVAYTYVNPELGRAFNSAKRQDVVVFLDVVGAGAKNMLLLHQKLPQLEQKVRLASKLADFYQQELSPSEFQLKHLDLAIRDVMEFRYSMFRETNEQLKTVATRIEEALVREGLSKEDFTLWASGDDMLLSANLAPSNNVRNLYGIIKNLSQQDGFSKLVRMIMHKNPTPDRPIDLNRARGGVATGADVIKTAQDLIGSERVFAEYSESAQGERQILTLQKYDSSIAAYVTVGTELVEKVQLRHPEWDVR